MGSKYNYDLFKNLFEDNIPSDINDRTYIEPFGGSMGLFKIISEIYSPIQSVYNDIKIYDSNIILSKANITHNLDYSKIFEIYNSEDSFFYIDPPYIGKEYYYEQTFENGMDDHFMLSQRVKYLKGKWMMSYQDHPVLHEWYSDYRFDCYKGNSIYHLNEIIIMNY